jgi:small-conductance mechanosensitive channel
MEFLDTVFLGNTIRHWAIAIAVMLATIIVLRVVRAVLVNRLTALAKRTATDWDDIVTAALAKTSLLFVLVVGVVVGMQSLTISDRIRRWTGSVLVIAALIQAGIWAGTILSRWLESYRKREMQEDPATATTVGALGFVGKLVLWTAVLLLALDNVGVDITTLVAGLGVGGVAVALALQNVLGDLFASLSIVLDKPFVLGDFLIIDNHLGSVEYVGLKTTRLRSLSGEQLIFANSDLLKSRVRNFGRMYQRRIVFAIGVTYQTPRTTLEKIPGIIREAVEAQEKTKFDRSHFKEYGDFSINFETVYYVTVPDYNTYMDIQQAINLRIHERFENEGIEFAYPTQTLFLVKEGEQAEPASG